MFVKFPLLVRLLAQVNFQNRVLYSEQLRFFILTIRTLAKSTGTMGPSTYYVILHTVFYVKRVTFFLVNRVEHQKLNQTTAELPFG